jgi:hypothetical protein
MQHAQLINGIKIVIEALEVSGLREALAPRHDEHTELLLASLRKYAIAASAYSAAEQIVADLLGLAELDSSSVWAKLLGGGTARAHYHDRVAFVTHHLPRFVELLEESSQAPPSGEQMLCVTVVGTERGLSASRLVTVVNSVTRLYRASASLHGMDVEDLMLVSLDGGDDNMLWFEGQASAITWVKELLTHSFRWLALYREVAHIEARIELAKNNLPTIQTIRDLCARGNLSTDEAEELEHQVLLGLLAFFDAGALIPEMAEDSHQDPRDIVNSSHPPLVALGSSPDLDAVLTEIADLPEHHGDDGEEMSDDLEEVSADDLVSEDDVLSDDDAVTDDARSQDGPVGEEAVIELEPSAVEISDETL